MTKKSMFTWLLKNKKYTISSIDNINLGFIVSFILEYSENEVVVYSEGNIYLTEKGIEYLLNNRKEIFLKKSNKYWENIPDEYFGRRIELNEQIQIQLKGV